MNVTTLEITPDRQVILDAARALIPELRARSEEVCKNRSVPNDIIQSFYDAGLMELTRPKKFGGPELDFDIVFDVTRVLGEADGSMSWVYGVLQSHDHLVSLYPESVQAAYWSSERPLCASSYIPTGKAKRVEGGYELDGYWGFSSGVDHCDWVIVGGVVGMIDGPKPRPDLRLFMVNTKDVEIVDDWHVMGLAGTGSKAVTMKSAFVADEFVLSNDDVVQGTTPGADMYDNPLFKVSVWIPFGFSILAPATGIVRGAYESVLNGALEKAEAGDPMFESRRTQTIMRLANVSGLLEAAELLFSTALKETAEIVASGGEFSDMVRVRNRRNHVLIARFCREAMEILMQIIGGRGIREENDVQRAMRDVYAISAHPGGNWDGAMTSYGNVLLGGPPTEPFC